MQCFDKEYYKLGVYSFFEIARVIICIVRGMKLGVCVIIIVTMSKLIYVQGKTPLQQNELFFNSHTHLLPEVGPHLASPEPTLY